MTELPILKPQEIPFDHPDSCCRFVAGPDKPLLATPAAIEMYSHDIIVACYRVLQDLAEREQGIDYLQVFQDEGKAQDLWFIEDGPGACDHQDFWRVTTESSQSKN